MLRKSIFFVIAFMVIGSTVFAQDTRGWPPVAMLNRYNLTGMNLPTGMTDPIWNEEKDVSCLHIRFSGGDNVFPAIKNWLASNNWVFVEEETYMRDVTIRYEKEGIDFDGDKRLFAMEISFDGRRGYIRSALGRMIWDDWDD